MSNSVSISIRHNEFPINARLLRRIVLTLFTDLLQVKAFELGVHVVDEQAMAHLNETFLRHAGPTDVLAFDYAEPGGRGTLCGEIFICAEETVRQARRFRVTWSSELVRYLVHGALHLTGYDDHGHGLRRKMKRKENQLLHELAQRFYLRRLGDAERYKALYPKMMKGERMTTRTGRPRVRRARCGNLSVRAARPKLDQ